MSNGERFTPLDAPALAALAELRCALSTIAGLAESNGHRAVQEIAMTARAGLARIKLIYPQEVEPKENGSPCEYFIAKDCLDGCHRTECQEAGTCLLVAA